MTRESFLGSVELRVNELITDSTFGNQWAQVRSKQLLASLAPDAISSISYTYSPARLIRNATSVLQSALILLQANGSLTALSDSLRRAAEAMEYLASLNEGGRPATTRLVAAGLYQLAGYEANSLCLARSLPVPALPTPNEPQAISALIDRWTSFALQRQFIRLTVETEMLEQRLPELERALLAVVAGEDGYLDDLASLPVAALAVTSFRAFALANLRGLPSQGMFFEACKELNELLIMTGRSYELLQIRTFEGLARRVFAHSVWTLLAEFIESDPIWSRYAVLSARGRASNMLNASGRVELWESQRRALQAGLLSEGTKGFSIRMPTSAGKTRIAELAILRTLTHQDANKVLYIAPFRALADEVEGSLAPTLADLGFRVSSVIGGFELDDLESQLIGSSDLLITTPERLTLLLRGRPEYFEHVGLVVLDEGHIIENKDRGARYEMLLTQLRQRMPEDGQVLFISAVISSENAADFAEWLCGHRDAVIDTQWRPARQLVGVFNGSTGRITYPLESMVGDGPVPFVPRAAQSHHYTDYTQKLHREKVAVFPAKSKGELAAELAINFVDQGPVLVFTTQRGWAESVARTIARGLQLRRQTLGSVIPRAFTNGQADFASITAVEVAERWLGPESLVLHLLRSGIGVHHAGFPDPVRQAIEDDFRSGRIRVLVATSTLAQGVNLPVKTVIVHSVTQHIEGPTPDEDGENVPIGLRDFRNIAGRAGRATLETEGHVIMVALNDWEAAALEDFLREEVDPIRGQLFRVLQDLANDRLSNDVFRYQMDSELLGLMVEETIGSEAEKRFEEFLGHSFVRIQALSEQISLQPLRQRAFETLTAIRIEVVDDSLRAVFAKTGYDVRSCQAIVSRISEKADVLRPLLTSPDASPHILIASILTDIGSLPQMVTDYEFEGDLGELAADWIGQLPMPEVVERYLPNGADERKFHRFLADFFGFRLPWGIGAYTQIAENVLGISGQLAESPRWLPSMVRYGVPTPKATWAMTLGCPSRELASVLAGVFVEEYGTTVGFATFIDWLSAMTEEDLVFRFGATRNEAEVMMRRVNVLVPSDRSVTESLRAGLGTYETKVVGLGYSNRSALLPLVTTGATLALRRDYGNQYDANAIEVLHGSSVLGYMPRGTARLIAPQMDAGFTATAIVDEVTRPRGPVSIRVRINTAG